MTNKPDITIIIPAHNEEEGIADIINGIKRLNEGYEIIVVDDGSTDNTYKLASGTCVKVIRHPYNKGYGAALKTGIRNAETDVVLFMDADGQHKPSDIKELIQYIGEYDMVVGARTKKSLLRRYGGYINTNGLTVRGMFDEKEAKRKRGLLQNPLRR